MERLVFEHGSWRAYRWVTPVFAANVYLVAPADGALAMLVDAGGRAKEIIRALEEFRLELAYIVLTHKHLDHSFAARKLRRATGARILAGRGDTLRKKPYSRGGPVLDHGDVITLGALRAEVISTPGHTRGGISLHLPGAVFTGDTLFEGGIGRTDLPGGSLRKILHSINEKLLAFPDETVVYPGHGPPSTVGKERRTNPFLTGELP